jgi:aminopeptidase
MTAEYLDRYAQLLVSYCLNIKPGDRLLIQTTPLAEPLVREVYKFALEAGAAAVEIDWMYRWRGPMLFKYGTDATLSHLSPLLREAYNEYETYLHIRAPYNLRDTDGATPAQAAKRQATYAGIQQTYMERTGSYVLRRNLCQYPTDAAAQEADMSLEAYTDYVIKACKLDRPDPANGWLEVRAAQQAMVDKLNAATRVRYVGPNGTDISFSTEGRIWINSDGRTNMPSGEVYTSPVEDSVEGEVFFSFPSIHGGYTVEDVRLHVRNGYIESWEASQGKEYLDKVFALPGARRFGEAAIGTNYSLSRITKNILYDEKIGGSIHMAIGQSYLQCNGKNDSPIHWDLITDMTQGGKIFADGELIYQNGQFIL